MKKRYIYIATLALFLGACSDTELEQAYTPEQYIYRLMHSPENLLSNLNRK